MLKLEIKKPRKFISSLLSKKSVTTLEMANFNEATQSYLAELEKQRIAKQSEPNIVSNALKPYFEALDYNAQSYSQKGQSGMDLALMLEHSPSVIIEAKVYESSAMITKSDINKKALHEAILYFMRERYAGNKTLYHIIITDFYNWFVFDAKDFERLFWQNSEIKKIFNSVKDPSVLGNRTEDFYAMVSTHIETMKENLIDDKVIACAYFDLRDKRSEKENIALYKLLSKDTLLKAFNPNDANTLNKAFYAELLYLLGLEEVKSGGKKVIQRAKAKHSGALYENIVQKLVQYDKPTDFESVIRLMIIWINRILFLKLLESQLIKWNDSSEYAFLNADKIKDFDRLEMLFFDILAKKPHNRGHREFDYVPYLNSSLFEPHAFEQKFLTIATLQDDCLMPYYAKTVLKDAHSKRKEGEVNMLHYLFEFLDAYDFSSEGSEELVSESKSLINASVLGLIFEKLNGYKDGSFYTPSFITMYMSKETITKSIVEKFNQTKGWKCASILDVYNEIEDKKEANEIIDSLTICDPAVGSGHFLVSSLNTILEIKSYLKILYDEDGMRIKYTLIVENDELIVRDDEGEIFEYKRNSKEKTRIQQMLFSEKQKIIENSLFGVDINPNSAQITRLRLWIELLKNSYYDDGSLVTMPNIDINIKVGNSLISRYGLDDEIDIPHIKHAIERYKASVKDYKEGNFLSSKEDIRSAIEDVKGMFGLTLKAQWTQTETYKKVLGKYVKEYGMDGLKRDMQLDALEFNYGYHGNLFEEELSTAKKKEKAKLLDKVVKATLAIEEIEKGKIYENAFEWRFEFPEVLDVEGNFVGFDVVIGNPPYIMEDDNKEAFNGLHDMPCYQGKTDIWHLFTCKAIEIAKQDGYMSFIAKNQWLDSASASNMRRNIYDYTSIKQIIDFGVNMVFEEAAQQTMIFLLQKNSKGSEHQMEYLKYTSKLPLENIAQHLKVKDKCEDVKMGKKLLPRAYDEKENLSFSSSENEAILHMISQKSNFTFDEKEEIIQGIIGGPDKAFIVSPEELEAFDEKEKSYFKMLHTSTGRYYTPDTQKYICYIAKHNFKDKKIEDFPNIETFFKPTKDDLIQKKINYKTPNKPYFYLHRERDESFFKEGAKIIFASRTKGKSFTYTDKLFYGSRNLFFIKSNRVSLKYITALLNSNLMYFYMTERLKHTGDLLQIDKNQFMKIPLYAPENTDKFDALVDTIITLKKQNKDTTELEAQIDQMVYALYGLSEEEVALVEGRDVSSKGEIGYNNPTEEQI